MSLETATIGAPLLEARSVELRYASGKQSVLALDHVSFEVKEKEFAVIVGPSGCGKSSLLYLAAGLLDCTGGEIVVGGAEVDGPGRDRGMVFQAYTLFPWLTVAVARRDTMRFQYISMRCACARASKAVTQAGASSA